MPELDVKAAVATIEYSRETHVEWASYLRRNPSYKPGAIGEAEYHEQAVGEYDNVLAVLRTLPDLAHCTEVVCERDALLRTVESVRRLADAMEDQARGSHDEDDDAYRDAALRIRQVLADGLMSEVAS